MKKLKVLMLLFFTVAIAIFISSSMAPQAVNPNLTTIWTPRPTNPVFALPGQQITVEVKSSVSIPTTGWTAQLENDLRSWNATVNSVATGMIHHGTESGYIFTITIPSNIPPELFKLVLTDTVNGGSISSPRSVKVETSFEESFYILHISDEHVAPGPATYPDGRNSSGTSSAQMKQWVEPVINTINPRFVMYTGDNCHQYYSSSSWRGMTEAKANQQAYIDSMSNYKVATVCTAGNHEIGWSDYVQIEDWKQEYEKIMGQRAFSFRMGQFYVNVSEWTTRDYFNWSVSDWNQHWNDPTVTYRLIATHYYDGESGWTTISKSDKPANLLIAGHNHTTSTISSSPYKAFTIQSAQGYNTTAFYNFVRSGNTWTCPQINSRVNNVDYFTLFSGAYGTNLKVTTSFANANNGTATTNTCTINNQINQRFYHGRVRFLMARGNYTVTGGTILAQYDYGSNGTAVVVLVDILPTTTTTVSISPAQGPPPSQDLYGNRIVNHSFEADGSWAANPTGWSTSGSTPSADFAESVSNAHSGSFILSHWNSNAYQVYTYQTINNIPNGIYTLKAWVKRGSGHNQCYMNAKDYGGAELKVNVPVTGVWTQISIPNIRVTNGQCTIGFYSDGNGGNWFSVDDVEFYLENLVLNPSFEDDGAVVQSPFGWSTSGATPAADSTEANAARTGNYKLSHWRSTAYEVYTYQTKTNLPNGTYTLKAWVKSGGGQNACYMNAKDYGGAELRVNLPVTGQFTQITIPNINVTNGQCTFGFYSNANPGNWINVDDVEFYKNP